MITTFDKTNCEQILDEVKAALKVIAAKHGVDFKPSRGSYSKTNVRMGVEFLVREVGGVSREQAEFNRYCQLFSLKPEDWGKQIKVNGEDYVVAGVEPSRPKFAYRLRRVSDDKIMLHTDAVVERIRNAPVPHA